MYISTPRGYELSLLFFLPRREYILKEDNLLEFQDLRKAPSEDSTGEEEDEVMAGEEEEREAKVREEQEEETQEDMSTELEGGLCPEEKGERRRGSQRRSQKTMKGVKKPSGSRELTK